MRARFQSFKVSKFQNTPPRGCHSESACFSSRAEESQSAQTPSASQRSRWTHHGDTDKVQEETFPAFRYLPSSVSIPRKQIGLSRRVR